MKPIQTIGLILMVTGLYLLAGLIVVRLVCGGDCGGNVLPGVPWGPP